MPRSSTGFRWAAVLAILLIAVVTACGEDAAPTSAPTATRPPAPTATPTANADGHTHPDANRHAYPDADGHV